ncbi:helix-turn-helix domain-containing protein [Agromyces cerinus]
MAEYLGVSADTVRVYAHKGDIPSFKIGNRLRFYRSEVRAHLTRTTDPWAAPRARRSHNWSQRPAVGLHQVLDGATRHGDTWTQFWTHLDGMAREIP